MTSHRNEWQTGLNSPDAAGHRVFVSSLTRDGETSVQSYLDFADALDSILETWLDTQAPKLVIFRDLLGNPQGCMTHDALNPEIAHLMLADGVARHFRVFAVLGEDGNVKIWTETVNLRGSSLSRARRLGNPLLTK